MSVAYTEQAVLDRTKTVTRRKGWWRDKHGRPLVKVGDRLTLCRKVMGRKPGEKLVRLVDVEVVSLRRERLAALVDKTFAPEPGYGRNEMIVEGFPGMHPTEFLHRYFHPQGLGLMDFVTRIEWRYIEET